MFCFFNDFIYQFLRTNMAIQVITNYEPKSNQEQEEWNYPCIVIREENNWYQIILALKEHRSDKSYFSGILLENTAHCWEEEDGFPIAKKSLFKLYNKKIILQNK